MIRETYKGCKIKVVPGKGRNWGLSKSTLNGVEQGYELGNQDQVLDRIKRTIDFAANSGPAESRFSAEWYAPGTYELCLEGHVKPIGGECGHDWCVRRRAQTAA